jgi:hypothetical protein
MTDKIWRYLLNKGFPMKKILAIFVCCFYSVSTFSSEYIVVGVAGFQTFRSKHETENIFSSQIDTKGQSSGVWTYAPTRFDSNKILKTVYLTHFSNDREINSVIDLFLKEEKTCSNDRKMILIVNSWGAKVSQKLARRYEKKCHQLPFMTFMIEGISKPTISSFTEKLISENCINLFQIRGVLHGDKISNCQNILFTFPEYKKNKYETYVYFEPHVLTEWKGAELANMTIRDFLDDETSEFSVMENERYFHNEGIINLPSESRMQD